MRYSLLVPLMLVGAVTPAPAQLSIGINIGLNVSSYPDLEPIPGYPAYYAPGMNSNYFFYDGMYWVYENDTWYSSSWYNVPWDRIGPQAVPLYLLRVPVRYYRSPPTYFRGWQTDAPPRWGEHWGNDWQQQRPGWDRWNRNKAPAPAPLPTYQRQYPQDRYPRAEQQQDLRRQNYKYQPRDAEVRQHVQPPAPALMKPLPVPPRAEEPNRPPPQVQRQPAPPQHEQRPAPNRPQEQAPRAAPPAHEPAPAAARPTESPRENRPEPKDRQPPPGQGKDRDPGDERGREPKK